MYGHNCSVTAPSKLTLSEVARSARNGSSDNPTWRRCPRCGAPLPAGARSDAVWCSGACRIAALRAKRAGRPISTIAPALGRPTAAGAVDNLVDLGAQNQELHRARRSPRALPRPTSLVPVTARELAGAIAELAVLVLMLSALFAAVVFGDAVLNGRPS
jgi:hypothetical protein